MYPSTYQAAAMLAAGITCLAGVAHAASPAFSDGDFSGFVTEQIPGYAATGWSGAQEGSGGNPGTFWKANDAGVLHFNYNPALVYDPADGAIESLTFGLDYKFLPNQTTNAQMSVFFGLLQNGVIYDTRFYGPGPAIHGATAADWTTYVPPVGLENIVASGLTNAGYDYPVGVGPSPDFSVNGAPIYFGFTTGSSGTSTAGFDNYSVVVNLVPEPASLLAVAGLGAFGLMRRRAVSR